MRLLLIAISMVAVATLDSEDPATKQAAWLMFVASAAISTLLFAFLTFRIGAKKDATVIEVPVEDPSQGFVGKLLKVEGSDKAPEKKKTTIFQYDTDKLREFSFQRTVLPSMIIIFVHFKFGSVVPLMLQSMNSLIGLFSFELVQIHLMGRPAVGKLARPFVPQGMLGMLSGQPFGGGGASSEAVAPTNKRK